MRLRSHLLEFTAADAGDRRPLHEEVGFAVGTIGGVLIVLLDVALAPFSARTIHLNANAGIVFRWLYRRRSLEAAMVAHTAFHVPLAAASVVQVALL